MTGNCTAWSLRGHPAIRKGCPQKLMSTLGNSHSKKHSCIIVRQHCQGTQSFFGKHKGDFLGRVPSAWDCDLQDVKGGTPPSHLLRTLIVDSEVSWMFMGMTYSMVKHRPRSSPVADVDKNVNSRAREFKIIPGAISELLTSPLTFPKQLKLCDISSWSL